MMYLIMLQLRPQQSGLWGPKKICRSIKTDILEQPVAKLPQTCLKDQYHSYFTSLGVILHNFPQPWLSHFCPYISFLSLHNKLLQTDQLITTPIYNSQLCRSRNTAQFSFLTLRPHKAKTKAWLGWAGLLPTGTREEPASKFTQGGG